MNKLILSTLVLCLFSLFANAQQHYQWDAHGIGFTITDDFNINTNNHEEFTAASSDGLIEFQLFPWQDELVTESELEVYLLAFVGEMASDTDIDIDNLDADKVELDDFTGSYVIMNSGTSMILTAFLLDTASGTNLIAQVIFEAGNEDEAINILSSLYAYD